MSFTIQHPESGLFWTSGIFGRVQLGATPNVYTLEGPYIKNVNSGNYVNHVADILHEGGVPDEFVFGDDGVLCTQGKTVTSGAFLHLLEGEPTKWVKVEEAASVEEDVPVTRAAALIEEALNATKECGEVCKCGAECECENCECSEETDTEKTL
jgi:hypothetical protein